MKQKNGRKEKGKITGRKKGCKDNKKPSSFELKPTQNYTAEQLAEWWLLPGKNKELVLKAIRLGLLPASKIGREYKILGADALKYQKQLRVYKKKSIN